MRPCPTVVFAGSLSLAWDASPDSSVVGYIVEWGESSGSYTDEVDVGNVTTATIDGLADGQTYYVIVRAYTSDGTQSGPSNQAVGVATGSSSGGVPTPDPDPDPDPDPTPDPNPDPTPAPDPGPAPTPDPEMESLPAPVLDSEPAADLSRAEQN